MELSANPEFLAALLLDEDCDGFIDEYDELCPPAEELDEFCDSGEEPGGGGLCEDLLSDGEREAGEEDEEPFDLDE